MNALLCTISDAATSLAIGRTKLYELIKAGSLETVTIGRRRLVTCASLQQLIDGAMDPQHRQSFVAGSQK